MKDLSPKAKTYMFAVYAAGAAVFAWQMTTLSLSEPALLLVLCAAGSLASIYKVDGVTIRSHYSINFLIYGFTFGLLDTPSTLIVIAVSSIIEGFWHRTKWYIQTFNAACYIVVLYAASLVHAWIVPGENPKPILEIAAILTAMAVFTLLNHTMVGLIVWFARGETFRKSGVFEFLPLMIDMTLMSLGASLVIVWRQNPYGLILFLLPLYLIYSTLRVPALERQTETDSKTGLFNHGYFMQQVENELRRASRFDRPLSIIIADLDLLRNINNTYGHLAGDEVLIRIAAILREAVREYDIVARFGGEEFAILMPETDVPAAFERAEAIRQMIEQTAFIVPTSVTPIKVTISLGVAGRERFDEPAQEIIHNADTALYHSKLKGRNRTYICANQTYASFQRQPIDRLHVVPANPEEAAAGPEEVEAESYEAAEAILVPPANSGLEETAEETKSASAPVPSHDEGNPVLVNLYIGLVVVAALFLLGLAIKLRPASWEVFSTFDWLALAICAIFVILAEMLAIELYVKHTTVSTSAVPILAGTLLFGVLGAFVLSATFAITAFIKYRSPFSRLLFNFGNQMIAAMVYTGLIELSGRNLLQESVLFQLLVCLVASFLVYLTTTVLVATGVSLDLHRPMLQIWKEQYAWLATSYIGMGFIAYSLIFGYKYGNLVGIVLMTAPLVLLRLSQKQHVDRTRTMVNDLHEKQRRLERTSGEIRALNNGLLDTLAEVIDLGDPYVLGHSMRVAELAEKIATRLGLHKKQVELIRSASMLHDIGKLGISPLILSKPSKLTPEEYESVKKHVVLGYALLEKSPSLRPLAPIIGGHHERYDGKGYPNGLRSREIPLEARIIAACDAIETMNSDRPYRRRMPVQDIIEELERCSGMQFDPQVVQAAVQVLIQLAREEAAAENPETTPEINPMALPLTDK